MIFEDTKETSATLEANPEKIQADEFFQREGLNDQERTVALRVLEEVGTEGWKKIDLTREDVEGIPHARIKVITGAVFKWQEIHEKGQ